MNVPDNFYALEVMVADHDADADAPLRRGEQPFSWLVVEQLARRVLHEFSDLRVALWLLRATMAQRSVEGLAEGLQELVALLSQRPVEAPDEEALEDLGVQLLWLSGPAFRAQVERLEVSVDASVGTLLELGGVGRVNAGPAQSQPLITALETCLAATLAISQVGRDLDLVPLPDFGPLQTIFQRALRALIADAAQAEAGEGSASPLTDTASPIPMVVSSRDDVRRTLDKLLEYFQVHEPGHPAPVLLSRVRRMVGADFETLMNELYQDGPKLVQLINAPRQS